MLAPSCPEGRNNLGLATVTASFKSEEKIRFGQCMCTAHSGFLLPFYPQVQSGTR